MNTNFLYLLLGIFVTIIGFFLLTRKKFMVKNNYHILVLTIIVLAGLSKAIKTSPTPYALIIFILGLALIMGGRGSYCVYNVNEKMIYSTLISILNEKGIHYMEDRNSVVLKDYNDKSISYKKQSNDSIVINLEDIIDLPFYGEIRLELRTKIKNIHDVIFPTTGVLLIVLGIVNVASVLFPK